MNKQHRSLGIIFWSVSLTGVGILCAIFFWQEMAAFFNSGEMSLKAESEGLFVSFFLMMRLATVLICFLSAGLLYLHSPLTLWFLRALSFIACGISFINPDYVLVEKVMLVSFQSVFMLYLFRQKTEMRFEMTVVEQDYFVGNLSITEIEESHHRSRLVGAVAFAEFIVGALLLNVVLWQMPREGWHVALSSVFNIPASFVLAKPWMFLLSFFLCVAAFMTMQFNVWGRKINIYFSMLLLVISSCGIFFLEPANLLFSKSLFNAALSCAILWSFCVLFL